LGDDLDGAAWRGPSIIAKTPDDDGFVSRIERGLADMAPVPCVRLLGGRCHANRQMIKAANVLFDAPLRDQFCVLGVRL
jgi:hypothetical protein